MNVTAWEEDRPKDGNPLAAPAADAGSPPVIELNVEPNLTHSQLVCHPYCFSCN